MKTLLKWLRGAVENGASNIELRSGGMALQSVPVSSNLDDEIIALLDNLTETAQEEANNNTKPGPTSFKLKAYFDERKPLFSPSFKLRTENEDEEYEAEEFNEKGLLSQLMRHNEVMMRMTVQTSQKTIEQLSQQNIALTKVSEDNLIRRLELAEQQEELISQKESRHLEAVRQEKDDERKDQIMKKVIPLLPIVANKFLNSRKLPEPVNAKVEIMKNIANQIPPNKLMELQRILGPEISMQLFELFSSIADDSSDSDSDSEDGKTG